MSTAAVFLANPRRKTMQVREGDTSYHFDRTGRFLYAASPQRVVRRGLNNRLLEITIRNETSGVLRSYRDIPEPEKSAWLNGVYQTIRDDTATHLPTCSQSALQPVTHWTAEQLATDEQAFNAAYQPVSILPPSEYKSLVVQVTEGCSYNRCAFCDFYRDRPFHVKSDVELGSHLQDIRNFLGDRILDYTDVFLGDGNAFVMPTRKLLSAFRTLRQDLGPMANSLATFMDTFTFEHKSDDELRLLRMANLHSVYAGLETGCDPLRLWLKKPGTTDEAVAALNRCKGAGFRLGVMVLVGIGGREIAEQHLSDTLAALQRVKFTTGDLIYLSPFVEPDGTEYADALAQAKYTPLSELEVMAEVSRWHHALRSRTAARVTQYFVKEHIY